MQYNKTIFLFVLCILLVGTISAFEIDNVKSYDPKTRTATITNLFGYGEDIAKIKLDSGLTEYVITGKDRKVGEFTIESFEDYNNAVGGLEFQNVKDSMKKFEREFIYKYEKGEDWIVFNEKTILPKGIITIGIFTSVHRGDHVEWIPTLFGEDIEEWAAWQDAFDVGLISYHDCEDEGDQIEAHYNFNETNPRFYRDVNPNNADFGKYCNFTEFDKMHIQNTTNTTSPLGFYDSINGSISVWLRPVVVGTDDDFLLGKSDTWLLREDDTGPAWKFSGSAFGTGGGVGGTFSNITPQANEWVHIVGTFNATHSCIYINGSINNCTAAVVIGQTVRELSFGGNFDDTAYDGGGDELAIWNRTLSPSEVSDLYDGGTGTVRSTSTILLDIPPDGFSQLNVNISFNCTVEDGDGLDTIKLILDGQDNLTFVVGGATNSNITVELNMSLGFHTWNCTGNDTLNNQILSPETRNFTVGFLENSQTFENTTTEGNTEIFVINMSVDASSSIASVSLFYNQTKNNAGFTQDGGNNYIASRSLIVPPVPAAINFTFYWEFETTTGTKFNSSANNQSVSVLSLDDCSTNTVKLFNFTMVDEELQTNLLNTSFEVSVNIVSFDRSVEIANFSDSINDTNPVEICLNVNLTEEATYSLDLIARYGAQDSLGSDYDSEYYNIVNSSLTNATTLQNIFLFDILSSDSTDFQVTFTGSDFVAVEGALINLNRQYISENLFKTVELPLTDSNGQTILHLVRNDIIYNIVVTKGNVVLGTFSNIIAFCDDFTIGNCKMNLNAFSSSDEVFNYDDQIGIIFTAPTFDNSTRGISFNFQTSDGTVKTVNMDVTKNDIFGNSSVCNNTLTSSGGTLICIVPEHVDDSTVNIKIFVDGILAIEDKVILAFSGFGAMGYFIFFVFMLAFILMFAESKSGILVGILLGFISAISLGILKGKIVGIGASGIWLFVIVLLMLWKLNKERKN